MKACFFVKLSGFQLGAILPLSRHLAMSRNTFGCHIEDQRTAISTCWVGAKDTAKCTRQLLTT